MLVIVVIVCSVFLGLDPDWPVPRQGECQQQSSHVYRTYGSVDTGFVGREDCRAGRIGMWRAQVGPRL
jgi:hypothetical protein